MPDVWSAVGELEEGIQRQLADVLETRGADPQQRQMRRDFLSEVEFPAEAHVLEIGCGTGVLTRAIARWPGVADIIGVDPASALLERARDLSQDAPNVRFEVADGRRLPFEDAQFDVVVFDSTLCHVPEPAQAVAEAHRVLRRGGLLAAFDGDYATATVALGDHDPLQRAVDAMMANSVNDRWLVRKLPSMFREAGFEVLSFRSHGFAQTSEPAYMLTVIDRGVDILHGSGQLSEASSDALRKEARRRVAAGRFFGHIAYGSIVGGKP